jgi:hypothetical protein
MVSASIRIRSRHAENNVADAAPAAEPLVKESQLGLGGREAQEAERGGQIRAAAVVSRHQARPGRPQPAARATPRSPAQPIPFYFFGTRRNHDREGLAAEAADPADRARTHLSVPAGSRPSHEPAR